jgi:hypothetical protein
MSNEPPPVDTGPTVIGVVAASLIHTEPLVAVALMVGASTHKASLALPTLMAAVTVTAPATTFGVVAFEWPVMPSSTAPVAELKVAVPVPVFTESIAKLPWPPITTGPPSVVTEATVAGVVAASLIHTPPPLAAVAAELPLMLAALTHSASFALPALTAALTVTAPAVTFGLLALEGPRLSSTAPVAEFKVVLPLPVLTVSTSKFPWLPSTAVPPFVVTEVTVTGVVAASLIHTPPPLPALAAELPLMVGALTHSASLALPAATAAVTVTAPAVTFGLPAFELPLMPSSTAPVAELKVALPLPVFTVSTNKFPWPPITAAPPFVVTEVTVAGVVAASLIHTPPPFAAVAVELAVMLAASTHK